MHDEAQHRTGEIAVIFVSHRTGGDETGDAAASDARVALAGRPPGYRGIVSARGEDGTGITISYWADEAAAIAWRAHPDHAAIRDQGRARWYDRYEVAVAAVTRRYDWHCA